MYMWYELWILQEELYRQNKVDLPFGSYPPSISTISLTLLNSTEKWIKIPFSLYCRRIERISQRLDPTWYYKTL